MKIHKNKSYDFGYLYIEDVYTNKEFQEIHNEIKNFDWVLDNLPRIKQMRVESGAHDLHNNSLIKANGMDFDEMYRHRDCSATLTHNRKMYQGEIKEAMETAHPANVSVDMTTSDSTFLNRYKKGDKYNPHRDFAFYSIISFLNFDNKEIEGGDFVFTDYNINFKFKNNSAVYFPSWVKHHCTEIKSDSTRYSLAQFITL
jgi:hypothetical protein